MKYKDVWGVNIINTTPHDIMFMRSRDCALIIVPPSGAVINAVPFTDKIKIGAVTIITSKYKGNPSGYEFLSNIPTDGSIIVVGSIIAALAYPGKVKSLITWKGYKQLPPHKRVYLHNKFRVFL